MGKNHFKMIILIVILSSLTLFLFSTYADIKVTQNLSSAGTITVSPNLSVYSDSQCTCPLESLDLGSSKPGNSTTYSLFIKNTGSGMSLSLNMTTSDWEPANANGPITITWDSEGVKLLPGQSKMATITLTVSPAITDITDFNVYITITGAN